MASSSVNPTYACSCLNVKIFPKELIASQQNGEKKVQSPSEGPIKTSPGWENVSVDEKSVRIAHDHLTLKTRSAESGVQLICRLCNTLVYRQMDEKDTLSSSSSASTNTPAPPPAVTGNPMSLASRERPDFKILFERDRQTWIQVFVGKQGCITGTQLESAIKNASPVFGLVVPSNSDTLSPSPTPPTRNAPLPSTAMPPPMSALSSSLLTTTMPTQQQQQQQQNQSKSQLLLNLPELFPPPPFTPSHPLFVNLAKDAKKSSKAARDAAEAEIAQYIEAKRREVTEYEVGLKRQTNAIWRAWRDSMNNDQQLPLSVPLTPGGTSEPISPTPDPRKMTKRHSSSASASSNKTSRTATVIKTFEEEPTAVLQRPEQQDTMPIETSSLSPSNATPRALPQMSALGASLRQTAMLYSPRRASKPSPEAEEEDATFESAFMDGFESDGPAKKTYTRDKDHKGRSEPGYDDDISAPQTRSRPSAMKRVSIGGAQSLEGESPDSTDADGGNPGASGKKKAVKFSSDAPDVVTVTREIKSEKLQKIKEEHARGEEAIFDLDDGDEHDESKPSSSPTLAPEKTPELVEETSPTESHKPPPVILSFKLPSYLDNGAPPRKIQYSMAQSLPATSVLSSMKQRNDGDVDTLGLDIDSNRRSRARREKHDESSSQSPYAGELRKIVAAQTPTHRSAWKAGSFEHRSRMSGGSTSRDANGGTSSRTAALLEQSTGGGSSSDEEESDEETLGMTAGRHRDASNESERRRREEILPSTSVPVDVPRMRRADELSSMADHDFEGAMARSVDPGPALELMVNERRAHRRSTHEDEDDSGEDTDTERRVALGLGRSGKHDEEEDEEGDAEAKDLMQRMIEGRGSLHAQRILSHIDRGVPASMWRSLA